MSEKDATAEDTEPEILYQAHPSMVRNGPLTFTIGVLLLVAPVVIGIVVVPNQPLALSIGVVLLPLIIGAIVLFSQYAKCKQTEVTLTDQETIVRRGVFSRSHLDVRHANVRSAYVQRSLSDRLFGVGSISLYTSGDKPEVTVHGLPDPLTVRQIIKDHADI